MRVRPLLPLYLCFASLVTLAVVRAQNAASAGKAPVKPAAPTADEGGNVIIRNSPQGTAYYEDERGIARITKDVTVVQTGQDFILYAQDLTYNKPKNQAVGTGDLRIETRNSTIRGSRLFADFNTKIITITGNVTVDTQGKGNGITGGKGDGKKEFAKKPSKILCDRADWDYEGRQATLTGNIRMTQGENSGTCERILYDEPGNIARLLGQVRFTDTKDRSFNTGDLTIYIDDGKIITKGTSTGFFNANKETKANAAQRPPKTPMAQFDPAPQISDDVLKQFSITPPPIPTPHPEPTEAQPPTPPPAANDAP